MTRSETDHLRTVRDEALARRRRAPIPGWLGRRRSRRLLAALAGLPMVAGLVAALLTRTALEAVAVLVMVASFGVCWPLLRRATRLLADAPEDALDEREQAEQAQAFHRAYLLLGGLLAPVVLLAVANDALDGRLVPPAGWVHVLTGVLLTAVLLPAALTAWWWHDLD